MRKAKGLKQEREESWEVILRISSGGKEEAKLKLGAVGGMQRSRRTEDMKE